MPLRSQPLFLAPARLLQTMTEQQNPLWPPSKQMPGVFADAYPAGARHEVRLPATRNRVSVYSNTYERNRQICGARQKLYNAPRMKMHACHTCLARGALLQLNSPFYYKYGKCPCHTPCVLQRHAIP